MNLNNYFDLNIPNQSLFGGQKQIIKGEHGITKNEKGEHFATAFHIYTGKIPLLAKPELKKFLLENFPGKSDLVNAFKNENIIEHEIEYVGDGYSLKKIKLEWIVEVFEKEKGSFSITSVSYENPSDHSKLNIDKEIVPLLKELSLSNIFSENTNSNKKLFDDIFNLIKENPDKYEVLSLVFFPILFEKTCGFLAVNSAEFKSLIIDYRNFLSDSSKIEEYTSYKYLSLLKYNRIKHKNFKISIELYQDFDQKTLMKAYIDLYYFIKLRNDLVHNDFQEEEKTELMNSSKKLLKLILEIIKEYY